MGLATYACLLGFLYICISTFVSYGKLRHFQGPPLSNVSEFWLFSQSWKANLNFAEYGAIQKYGLAKASLQHKTPY